MVTKVLEVITIYYLKLKINMKHHLTQNNNNNNNNIKYNNNKKQTKKIIVIWLHLLGRSILCTGWDGVRGGAVAQDEIQAIELKWRFEV